jgi:hypothetical protein
LAPSAGTLLCEDREGTLREQGKPLQAALAEAPQKVKRMEADVTLPAELASYDGGRTTRLESCSP